MAKSKVYLVNEIRTFIDLNEQYLIMCGTNFENFDFKDDDALLLPSEMLNDAVDWIYDYGEPACLEFRKLYKSFSPKIWARVVQCDRDAENDEFRDTPERKAIMKALANLRGVTNRNLPDFFVKNKRIKEIVRLRNKKKKRAKQGFIEDGVDDGNGESQS